MKKEMKNINLFLLNIILVVVLSLTSVEAFDFYGWVRDIDSITAVQGVNVTVYDPFETIGGEPWSGLTDANGFFNISGINDSQQAVYMVVIVNNYTNNSNIKVGPIIPPMPAQNFIGMPSPGEINISLNNLNWTLRNGALINITVFNETGYVPFGGTLKDKKIDWPLWELHKESEWTSNLNSLIFIPKERNYTATTWSIQSPPRGFLITANNISSGYYQLRINSSTILVNVSGYLNNNSAVEFTRIRAYWLIGGDMLHFDDRSSLDGIWANKFVNSTSGYYWHEVPSGTELIICGYANSSVYYEGCSNVTIGVSNVALNITLVSLAGVYNTANEPNTSKITFNLFKKFFNGSDDVIRPLEGQNYIQIKTTYNGRDVWWGIDTNLSGSAKLPIGTNSNISVRIFVNDAPPRKFDYTSVLQPEINLTLEAMDQMSDDKGNKINALIPVFYRSNSTCDLPTAPANCQIFNFSNASKFNPFKLLTLSGDISVRLILPSGVIIHYKNVDILAGNPDTHKPKQSANTTLGGTVAEAWAFGSMVPKEMYESVLVGVPYNATLISEEHPFKLLITELYNINPDNSWTKIWNSTADPNGTNVPSYYQDFSDYANGLFNTTKGGIICSKTNASAGCYVDIINNMVWFKIDHFSGLGPQIQSYAVLGNITSDKTVYSCWQDLASTQGCSALINLTVSDSSPFANQILNISVNNTAQVSGINYKIEWYNTSNSTWATQTDNNTLLINYNLTNTTHRFRINITLPYILSTKWNISFGINGTYYILDPFLDSINLTSPANNNLTTDQTPNFGFVLYSNNWTTQSCSLTLNNTLYGSNSSVTNGSSTIITASTIHHGNYSWKISCNVSGDSVSRWIFINDTIPPTITAVSVSGITSSKADLIVDISEEVDSCKYSGAGSGTLTGSGTSLSTTLNGLNASTSYNITVNCTDLGGNSAQNSTNFTTKSITTSSTSGGGSSTGGTTGLTGQFEKKIWVSINKEGIAVMEIKTDGMAATKVEFKVTEIVYGAWVQVKKIEQSNLSSTIKSSFTNKVYQYFEITKSETSLKENIIADEKIYFKVENFWLKQNNLSKEEIMLFRYNGGKWDELKTNIEKEDSKYTYYAAETPRFSYFLIGQKTVVSALVKSAEEPPTTPHNETIPEEIDLEKAQTTKDEVIKKSLIWPWIVLLVIMVVSIIAGIIYLKKMKK